MLPRVTKAGQGYQGLHMNRRGIPQARPAPHADREERGQSELDDAKIFMRTRDHPMKINENKP